MTVSFGIFTPPMHVGYTDLQRVWREADAVPHSEHAWLFDHLVTIGGDPNGPAFEGWTLLSALAAQTARLRLGLLVTSNRFRPPAVLAKMAATVDVVSHGRLDFGIGVGSRPEPGANRSTRPTACPTPSPFKRWPRWSGAAGDPSALDVGPAVRCRRRARSAHRALCNPKPVQRPRPPIVIGGRATGTLRIVAEHADVWNYPGDDLVDALARGAVLDRLCPEVDRHPAPITRSLVLPVDYARPATTRDHARRAIDAGFSHRVLGAAGALPTARRPLARRRGDHSHDVTTDAPLLLGPLWAAAAPAGVALSHLRAVLVAAGAALRVAFRFNADIEDHAEHEYA